MSAYTNNVISRAAFGGKCKDQDEFIAALKEVIVLVGGFHLADLFPSLAFLNYVNGTKKAANKVHEKTERILGGIINEHRIKRGTKVSRGDGESTEVEDIVDVFLRLQESEEFQISDSQIRYVIMDIFSGGSESISTSIDWAMVEMLRKPTVLKKAQTEVRQKLQGKKEIDEHVFEELNYLKAVVKESLRLHPSTALIARESMERCEINGYEIPKKTKVIVNAWATGRDEEHWVNADTFMPERFLDSSITYVGTNFELIPFGAGRRICPGFNFAIPTIELALAQLLYHFDWKLPNGIKPEELDMTETFGISTRRSTELHVFATPFSSSLLHSLNCSPQSSSSLQKVSDQIFPSTGLHIKFLQFLIA